MRTILKFLPVVTSVFVLAGCADGGADFNGPNGNGRLTIQLTDAPGDLEEAFVKFERVVLIRSEQDTTGSGRVELTVPVTDFIDLLSLTGGEVMELIDDADVPEGLYSELRVILDEAFVVLKDGRVFATNGAALPAGVTADGELKCPSCSQSGFKVKFNNGLLIDDEAVVVLDFDVGKSFSHEAGRSGKLIMHPVLRATAQTIALGRVAGTVNLATGVTIPACGGQNNNRSAFRPRAVMANDTATGVTDSLGVFRIGNLLPGNYTLTYVQDVTFANGDSLTFTAAAAPPSVVVPPGDSAAATYSISAATCH